MKSSAGLCVSCPHLCGARREEGNFGICNSDRNYNISSVVVHHGEEPVISGTKGICNIFFSHCNLQCIYCQNYQISRNDGLNIPLSLEELTGKIISSLDSGVQSLGFVSPSHMADQVTDIIESLEKAGRKPVFVWNSNGYDRVKTLKTFEDKIDVYLPDFKYSDAGLGFTLSGVKDYPQNAIKAIREMVRQKGTSIMLNDEGIIESGVIIRHLILPGYVENSLNCLKLIAEEISTSVNISLMSQYHPVPGLSGHPALQRPITRAEYEEVLEEYYRLGFYRGWTQEMESESVYNPDFLRPDPFKNLPG